MRQLLKAALVLPLLLSVATAVRAADDPAPPDANDTTPPVIAPAAPPVEAPAETHAGDTENIGSATSGKTLPLTLKLSDLGDNWRQLTISPQIEANDQTAHDLNNALNHDSKPGADQDAEMQKMMALLASGPGIYFTQGQTVTTGDASFLVAYHASFDAQEFKALFPANKPDDVEGVSRILEKYLRERTLNLALLNLRQVGTMSNIQPFNMDAQIAKLRAFVAHSYETSVPPGVNPPPPADGDSTVTAPATIVPGNPTEEGTEHEVKPPAPHGSATGTPASDAANAINNSSVARLQSIGAGLQNYLEDHDGILPPMQDAIAAKAALKDYASIANFTHPGTKEAYLPNAILSGKKLAHITNPAAMVAFYEAHPGPDGKRAILFLDGHVKRIKEAEWPLVKRASRVP